ncbi:zinc c3hc4 type (ring finger) domain-containing protein [Cystoisospora suis]|uniref:Zinc c3hc4 type (Ring finger) domain-containing protein n=1 Tax=Cystoisospora suis TaxID=483139 RepID=A0A2C6KIQ1_9APIC|nr:zinc c3hc4 type (ring finger) domain-containing protein [Cystoisospora suis]
MLRRWGRINVFAQYGIHILKKGLTTDQIQSLPHQKLSVVPVDQTSCSICLEDYHVGDDVRLLQPCGHLFHKSCIDIWLLRNAVCPNCKGSIFCPSSSSSSSTQCSGNSSERDCEEGERPSHLSGHPNTEQRNSSAGIHPREGVDDLPFYRGREAYADSDDIFDEEAWIGEDPSSSSRNFHSPLRYVLREDSSRL